MNNISVDIQAKKIIISKKFEKLARRFGSDESEELNRAINQYVGFKIIVHTIKTNGSKMSYKGFTYDFMKTYFEKTKGEKADELCKELEKLRGYKDGKRDITLAQYPYGKIKAWFLQTCPEIEENNDNTQLMLAEAEKAYLEKKKKAAEYQNASTQSAVILPMPEHQNAQAC